MHLDDIDEAEEAAQGHQGRELLNESFTFREPEQLTEEYGVQEAAKTNTRPEQVAGCRIPGMRGSAGCIPEVYPDRGLQPLRSSSEPMISSGL